MCIYGPMCGITTTTTATHYQPCEKKYIFQQIQLTIEYYTKYIYFVKTKQTKEKSGCVWARDGWKIIVCHVKHLFLFALEIFGFWISIVNAHTYKHTQTHSNRYLMHGSAAKQFCRHVYEHQVLPEKMAFQCSSCVQKIYVWESQIFLLNFPWHKNRKRGPLRSEIRLLLLLLVFSYSIWSGWYTTTQSLDTHKQCLPFELNTVLLEQLAKQ